MATKKLPITKTTTTTSSIQGKANTTSEQPSLLTSLTEMDQEFIAKQKAGDTGALDGAIARMNALASYMLVKRQATSNKGG